MRFRDFRVVFCPASLTLLRFSVSPSLHLLRAEETVTLTFKNKGGNVTSSFTPRRFEEFVSSGHLVYCTSTGSRTMKLVNTLNEATSVSPPDYLSFIAPFEQLRDLGNFKDNYASGLEQQTTRFIVNSPVFREKYGALSALAGGQTVTFYAADGKPLLEADGLIKNSVCLLFNEVKYSPTDSDMKALLSRRNRLLSLLAQPEDVDHTSPPGIMEELAGITNVVPVLCGFHFNPTVVTACTKRHIIPVTTNGEGFSIIA